MTGIQTDEGEECGTSWSQGRDDARARHAKRCSYLCLMHDSQLDGPGLALRACSQQDAGSTEAGGVRWMRSRQMKLFFSVCVHMRGKSPVFVFGILFGTPTCAKRREKTRGVAGLSGEKLRKTMVLVVKGGSKNGGTRRVWGNGSPDLHAKTSLGRNEVLCTREGAVFL